jgi:hypothetical protein
MRLNANACSQLTLDTLALLRPHGGMHGGSGADGLGVILGVGIPLFVLTILAVVFILVRRSIDRQMKAMRSQAEQEGIVLDAGRVWMTIRYQGFRSSNIMIGIGVRRTRVAMVLTQHRLVFMPTSRHYFTIAKGDLGRFAVNVADDGTLRLHTSSPPGATGSIEYRISVADAAAWVTALLGAGAQKG